MFSTTIGFAGTDGFTFAPDQAAVLAALQADTIAAAAAVAGACPRLVQSSTFAAVCKESPDVVAVRSIIDASPELAELQVIAPFILRVARLRGEGYTAMWYSE